MTKEEIEEGNKLIADIMEGNKTIAIFMGYRNYMYESLSGDRYMVIQKGKTIVRETNADLDLLYHSSWDWIMPVYNKIRDLPCIRMPSNGVEDSVMPHIKQMGAMKDGAIRGDIKKCWVGIVQFIKWHNNQTTKK